VGNVPEFQNFCPCRTRRFEKTWGEEMMKPLCDPIRTSCPFFSRMSNFTFFREAGALVWRAAWKTLWSI
jgi:hypothetical protein